MGPRVTEVRLRNYKSIGGCRVTLGPLTLLVGPNGAGKSNFLDALRFTAEALDQSLDYAIRQRGGVDGVRRRSTGHPTNVGVRLNLVLDEHCNATYAFEIGAQANGGYVVRKELALVSGPGLEEIGYTVERGQVLWRGPSPDAFPKVTGDRLLLVSLSGLAQFRPLYDALTRMRFYNVNPREIRRPQPHDPGDVLSESGANVSSVVRQMRERDSTPVARLQDYLKLVNPLVAEIGHRSFGPLETLEFRQHVHGAKHPWHFLADAMSDGTLRTVGLLAALFQRDRNGVPPSLVAIEEPEMTIHPGAAGVVFDALREASRAVQVIATTQSPDLLDHPELDINDVRVVKSVEGETIIGPADRASAEVLKKNLYTAGELLRNRQLEPEGVEPLVLRQESLFE